MNENLEKKDVYVYPQAAKACLSNAKEFNINVYIYGAAGSGKSELVKHFLGKKQYVYIDVKYCEIQDFDSIENEKTKIVVIDNIHEIAQMNSHANVYKDKICEIVLRDDLWTIIIGRGELPGWLTKVLYKSVFSVISEKQLYLNEKEIKQFLNKRDIILNDIEMKMVKERSLGYGFAVSVFCTEYYISLKNKENYTLEEFNDMYNRAEERFVDYLNDYVYDQWDVDLQDFIMETTIVESFDVKLAEMITGRNNVEHILEITTELGNFLNVTEKDGIKIYSYRLFLRKSMEKRLLTMRNKEQRNRLYCNAGLYYELNDDLKMALKMYEKSDNRDAIANCLIMNSRRAPNNASFFEIKKYYFSLPEEKIKKSVELMCAMSMLNSLILNPEESERWYDQLMEYAQTQKGSMKLQAKSRLLYLDIALPHRGSINLVEILKNAHVLLMQRKVVLPDFSVTSNLPSQMNGGKDFSEWSKKDKELAKTIGKILPLIMGRYGRALVNLALAESFFEKAEDNYEVITLINRGRMQAETEGNIEQCFVADGLMAWSMILNGKVIEAKNILIDLKEKVNSSAVNIKDKRLNDNINAFIVRCNLYIGDEDENREWLENSAPNEDMEFISFDRFMYLAKIRLYINDGKYELAQNLLLKILFYAEIMKRTMIEIEAKMLLGIVLYRLGNAEWKTHFIDALDKAYEYNFVRIFSREGSAITLLLKKCDWNIIDEKHMVFFNSVVAESEKTAHYYPHYLKDDNEQLVLSEIALRILQLQAMGETKTNIATQLNTTVSNIKYHSSQTYKKLGVSNKAAAIMEAKKLGLL